MNYIRRLIASVIAWLITEDPYEARERTARIIAIVRSDQYHPKTLERNLAAKLKAEMRRGRVNQVANIYRELEGACDA